MSPLRCQPRLRFVVSTAIAASLVLPGCEGAQRRPTGPGEPSSSSSEVETEQPSTEQSHPGSLLIGEAVARAQSLVSSAGNSGLERVDTVYPDIFSVMEEAGFELVESGDLADYLPLPPAARGQVGQFSLAGETIVVARVSYLSGEFAAPHAALLRERQTLLPNANERLVHWGPTVIHIKADSAVLADQVERLFDPVGSTQRTSQ